MTEEMLNQLGEALERSAESDLAPRRRVTGRRLAVAIAVLAVVVPSGAIAVGKLTGPDQVAASMPAGTLALAGTEPSCTVVEQNVEFHCVLQRAPAPEMSDWKDTVEPTVDATKHVNGGCHSLRSDGREWECYLGQAAVAQKIIGPNFLGEYAPSPGQG
jgi:hypothetical protein